MHGQYLDCLAQSPGIKVEALEAGCTLKQDKRTQVQKYISPILGNKGERNTNPFTFPTINVHTQ